MCEFVKSEKDRYLLILKGYLYKLERTTNEKTIWHCIENYSKKCPGHVHVEKGEVKKESKREQNYQPDRSKIEAKQAIESMKKIVKETELSSQVVLNTVSIEVINLNYFKLINRNRNFKLLSIKMYK